MTENKKILALDFDGVLCNSFHDTLLTAINTYLQCNPDNNLLLPEPLTPETVATFEKENPEFIKKLRQLMPLGHYAEDYYVKLNILDRNIIDSVSSQEDFNRIRKAADNQIIKTYYNLFYQFRHSLQKKDPDAWARLLPPFPGIPEAVRKLSNSFLPAITTTKDRQSVTILLKTYGIADLFASQNILDKDSADSKREQMIILHRLHNLDFTHIYFIDDKVSHLLEVEDLKVHTYLSTWGFNSERELETAKQHDIPLLDLEDLPHLSP
ncbi:MAG: hypothetical protein P8078_04885 [bacterium]